MTGEERSLASLPENDMLAARLETASRTGLLVLDQDGAVIASGGDWREQALACPPEVRALAERVIADCGAETALVRAGGKEWHATAVSGLAQGGQPIATVVLAPAGSEPWQETGTLAREKHQALCRLVSGMVHELRNPLASISLMAELLGMRPDVPDEARDKLADIVHHVERAEEVLQSLRRFSHEELPAMRLASLNDLVQDAARLERGLLTPHGIEIELALDPDLPDVLSDPSQLRLVVANLIRNAAESIREGGRPGTVRVKTANRHGVLRVVVEDDGPGIPVEVLPRIFDPYFTTKERGTGLGLAMSAGIVKAHGGHIRAENRPRRGARFLVDLPDPQHSTPARQSTALGVELTQGPTYAALVVDRDPVRLELLRKAIAAIGWKVHVAASNGVALRKIGAADFDAVLLAGEPGDPEVIDLCARTRLLHPELGERFAVLLSAEPEADIAGRLRLAGARVAVGLPDSETVQTLVQELVAQRER
jgi:signal transduction histidine kinase/CheY-like chemotaxis protein